MKICSVLLLMVLLLAGCTEDDPKPETQLPAATQQGLNTFGCKLAGEVFIPRGSDFPNPRVGATVQSNSFSIFGRTVGTSKDVQISIVVHNKPIEVGTYQLDFSNNGVESYSTGSIGFGAMMNIDCIVCTINVGNDVNGGTDGTLEITHLDRENRIVSGRFQFKAVGECGSYEVTEGRFDVRY